MQLHLTVTNTKLQISFLLKAKSSVVSHQFSSVTPEKCEFFGKNKIQHIAVCFWEFTLFGWRVSVGEEPEVPLVVPADQRHAAFHHHS